MDSPHKFVLLAGRQNGARRDGNAAMPPILTCTA